MSEELLPCPFCGGTDLNVVEGGRQAFVECYKCFAYGPNGGPDAWNTRAQRDAEVERLTDLCEALEAALERMAQSNARMRAAALSTPTETAPKSCVACKGGIPQGMGFHTCTPTETADEGRIDAIEAVEAIRHWCDAYPVQIFTPISDDETKRAVAAMNGEVPNASERLHASWARHILDGVRGYADAALRALASQDKGER